MYQNAYIFFFVHFLQLDPSHFVFEARVGCTNVHYFTFRYIEPHAPPSLLPTFPDCSRFPLLSSYLGAGFHRVVPQIVEKAGPRVVEGQHSLEGLQSSAQKLPYSNSEMARLVISVADLDPLGSESFSRIQIRSNCPDAVPDPDPVLDPTIKVHI